MLSFFHSLRSIVPRRTDGFIKSDPILEDLLAPLPFTPGDSILKSFNALTRLCWLVLEDVDTGGWCASKLGMGPEYPGLDESVEYARWRILHWTISLD
jgi:hypothetical protein